MSGAEAEALAAEEQAIEMFKVKKLIKSLEKARGNGTSMISLILPPKSQIPKANTMLSDEYGTASNIKSRVNRLSVLTAITSAQQRLKLYNRCPTNGLIIYSGEVVTDEGKIKKLAIDFEPFKPINTSLYMCDNKFHTEALTALLADDDRFGFIIMDGMGTLYGAVQGSTKEILHKFSVELPKKHGRGGQSSVRFARLRVEKRHNYMRKAAEGATAQFITDGERPNIKGLILAGSAELKNELVTSGLMDPRLVTLIIRSVDTSYGGENGFNQAIALSADALANVKFTAERQLIQKFFDEITMDSGKYCYGCKDTLTALEMSSVETLIVWEDLDIHRIELKHPATSKITVVHVSSAEGKDEKKAYICPDTGAELEEVERTPLVDWLAVHYKDFGAKLEFVTNKSQEGNQYCKGFGGIGGILRWKVDFVTMGEHMDEKLIASIKSMSTSGAASGGGGGSSSSNSAAASSIGEGGEGEEEEDEDGEGGGGAQSLKPRPPTLKRSLTLCK